jgi:tetratricopeptide (TPR) repeat protein
MTFGDKMLALMAEKDLSLRRLAKFVPCDAGYLSKISRDMRVPSVELADRLDHLLQAGGKLAELKPPTPVRKAPTGPGDTFLMLDSPVPSGQPMDMRDVAVIRETSQALVKLDGLYGGRDVLPLALRVFRTTTLKLGAGAYRPEAERDLVAATGELGEVAAWLAYDTDRQSDSRQLIHEARMLSRHAGDRSMELFQLTHLAMQSIYLHRPAEALRVVDELTGNNLPFRVTAVLEIRRSRALAQMGDRQRALKAIDRADGALAESITARDPAWTWWVTGAELSWHRGMAHAELGDWSASIPYLRDAGERRSDYQRAAYNDLAYLLNSLVHVRDWESAEDVLRQLIHPATCIASVRTSNLLARITQRIERTDGVPSTVSDIAGSLLQRTQARPGMG